MNEIKCPHCGTVFQVDESGYAQLVRQVRDAEFERDMAERERLLQEAHKSAVEAAETRVRAESEKELAEREHEVESLKQQLEAAEAEGALALSNAMVQAERERDALKAELARQSDAVELARAEVRREEGERAAKETSDLRERAAKEAAELRDRAARELSDAQARAAREAAALREQAAREADELRQRAAQDAQTFQAQLSERDVRIAALEQQLSSLTQAAEAERQLAVTTATAEAERRVVALEGQVRQAQTEREQAEAVLTVRMNEQVAAREAQLRDKDAEIARLRDQRVRLTTKLIGESLEQHCEMEFNRWRATAFRNAEFHKDNDVVGGSKGDYVYREVDKDGVDVLSIMFEMKTEEEGSTHHHKNEDFFKKLDQDRRNKHCEYAVLVSMLEPENEFYNGGIADVSYAYEKMYVIRPQLFVPMITILRNAALNGLAARRELAEVRQQNIDVTHFEEKMAAFQKGFGDNYDRASRKFAAAIEEIDRSIAHLQKVRDNLTASERQLRLANDKAQGLSIRKLTWGNPTMREAFAEARAQREQLEEEAAGEEVEPVEPDEILDPEAEE